MKSLLPSLSLIFLLLYLWKGLIAFLYIAIALLLIHLFLPGLDRWISHAWRRLGEWLAIIPNSIILGVVWLLIVTPLGWISRRGKNPLWIRKPQQNSFWKANRKNYSPKDLEKPW